MILESMSYEDIAKTMKTDFENELIRGYNSCFGRREEFGKKAMKLRADEWAFFGQYEKTTRNQNKYIFLFFTEGRQNYKMNGILRHVRLEYRRKDGTHVAVYDFHDLNNVTFYTPHYFERVRTRLCKDETIPLAELRSGFLSQHVANKVYPIDNPKYPNSIFGVSPMGISLGEMISPQLWEFRTYITFEMLKNDQDILAQDGMHYLDLSQEVVKKIPGLLSPNVDLKFLC